MDKPDRTVRIKQIEETLLSLHVVETRARNFKFERIETVAILRKEYEIPEEFRPHE